MVRSVAAIIAISFSLFLFSSHARAGFEETLKAYQQGNFDRALSEFEQLAEFGNHGAQYYLGEMYRKGTGVKSDLNAALKWYRLSADQDKAAPQYRLGQMYENGQGVPKSLKDAYMWFSLASTSGHGGAKQKMEDLAGKMSSAEVAEAKKMASDWAASR